MLVEEVYIEGFRGISKRVLKLSSGVNVVYGKPCSGKTSIVDAFLFTQRFMLNPSSSLETLLHTWFSETVFHSGKRKFSIAFKTRGESVAGVYGLVADSETNTLTEYFITGDTALYSSSGVVEVTSPLLIGEGFARALAPGTGLGVWEEVGKRRIKFENLPWKTASEIAYAETISYGFEVASRRVPEVLAKLFVREASGLSQREQGVLEERLKHVFTYAFHVNKLFRESVVVKDVDFKNAVGPSKLRGSVIDPYFSNLPWILYSMYRSGRLEPVIECLESAGVPGKLAGVERTVDNRYYIVASNRGLEAVRESIPVSFVKALAVCTALSHSQSFVVVDDFDEYLDSDTSARLLATALKTGKQLVLTTRRRGWYAGFAASVVEL